MDKTFQSEQILESNLKYFEIHAAQRLTVFNFYVAISGAILAALAAISQGPQRYALVGVILGLLLATISFLFSKLDSRTAFLIKHAESIIKKIESDYIPEQLSVFGLEDNRTSEAQAKHRFPGKMYTYGQIFHLLFWIFGAVGLMGALLMGARLTGSLDWPDKKDSQPQITLVVRPIIALDSSIVTSKSLTSQHSSGMPGLPNNVGNVASKTNPAGQSDADPVGQGK